MAMKIVGRERRKLRIRKKVNGTPERPRLTVFRSAKHQRHLSHFKGAGNVHLQFLSGLFKLPSIPSPTREADPNAAMPVQLAGVGWPSGLLEVGRRAHHHETLGWPEGDGHHVPIQAFAKTHARIEAALDDVHKGVVGHDLNAHAGVGEQEAVRKRAEDMLGSMARGIEAQRAHRRVPEGIECLKGAVDVQQRRSEAVKQALPGLGGGHAAGAAIEQANTQTRFQPPQAMAEGRRRDAEFGRRPAETAQTGNGGKALQVGEAVAVHIDESCSIRCE